MPCVQTTVVQLNDLKDELLLFSSFMHFLEIWVIFLSWLKLVLHQNEQTEKHLYECIFKIRDFRFVSKTICVKRIRKCESSGNITKIAKNW